MANLSSNLAHSSNKVNQVHQGNRSGKSTQNAPKRSYAKATKNFVYPEFDECIILDHKEGLTITDYARSVSDITGKANITAISRISKSKVSVFVKTKELADKLINETCELKIGVHLIPINSFIPRKQRVLISNIPPPIRNEAIIEQLEAAGISGVSEITFLRAAIKDDGYDAVSWRRQFFIDPADIPKIPEAFKIHHRGVPFWTYLSTGNLKCFLCQEEGHLAKDCKDTGSQEFSIQQQQAPSGNVQLLPTSQQLPNTEVLINSENNSPDKLNNEISNNNNNIAIDSKLSPLLPTLPIESMDTQATGLKRPLSNSMGDSNSATSSIPFNDKTSKGFTEVHYERPWSDGRRKKKKTRTNTPNDLDLSKVEEIMKSSPSEFVLTFSQYSAFLLKTKGQQTIDNIAASFTTDTHLLIDTLDKLKLHHPEHSTRNRIDRIRAKLINGAVGTGGGDEAVSSHSEYEGDDSGGSGGSGDEHSEDNPENFVST